MIFRQQKPRRIDVIFTGVVLLVSAALVLVSTPYHQNRFPRTIQAKGRVVSVDDSGIRQFGMVKLGTQMVEVEVLDGPFQGEIFQGSNHLLGKMDIDKLFIPGDLALVGLDLTEDRGSVISVNMIDHYRLHWELILLGAFCILLVAYAGFTGFKALVSFVFTGLVIWKVLLPLFLAGWDPVPVSLAVVSLITAVVIFLIGGFQRKGLTAFLGSIAGVGATCVLSMLFASLFRVHGAVRAFSETLLHSGYPHLDLTGLFLAGIFIASSGAVMDIAMDISASMEEVKAKHPGISRHDLIVSGFNVGRAVTGTMTTTLLLAYSGGYTTLLMMLLAQGVPMVSIFNLTFVASEILHIMVGSFGLVLVAPFTAIIGGFIHHRQSRS